MSFSSDCEGGGLTRGLTTAACLLPASAAGVGVASATATAGTASRARASAGAGVGTGLARTTQAVMAETMRVKMVVNCILFFVMGGIWQVVFGKSEVSVI